MIDKSRLRRRQFRKIGKFLQFGIVFAQLLRRHRLRLLLHGVNRRVFYLRFDRFGTHRLAGKKGAEHHRFQRTVQGFAFQHPFEQTASAFVDFLFCHNNLFFFNFSRFFFAETIIRFFVHYCKS